MVGPVAMLLDHVNVNVADPEQLDTERLSRLFQVLHRLRAGEPFSGWLSCAGTETMLFTFRVITVAR